MCVGELNMAWRAYRQMYLDVKRYIINKYWIKDSCNNALTAAQLMERGFTPHFSDADELAKAAGGTLPSDTTQAKNEIGNKMDNYYQSNCLAYATQWMQQLSKCTFYDSASITDIIIPQLVQVCMEGSDVNHPYGASSVKPSSTSQFRSFEEVINNYNQTHGITDYINCNSYRITAPKPYGQQLVYGNKPIYNKPEDCECEAIAGYYNKYQNASGYSSFSDYLKKVYNTTITDAALNQLLSLCKVNGAPPASCSYLESPLFLPPAFQCYTGDICIGCEQFKTADQAFRSKFPGISPVAGMVTDSIQIRNNLLYEQFMNYRFGFAKTIDEYLAFAKGCEMPVDSVSELQSIVSGYKASTSAASSWYYVGTGFQVTDPHQLFRDGQIKLPDSYHSTPAYCCVSPVNFFGKTVCLPDGYQVEARIRTTGWLLASLNVYSTDSTTAGGYICEYQSDGNNIYGGSFIDGRNQFISGQTIATVPGSLADWHVIKMRVTKTAYEQYVDGQLIKVYQKVPRLYGQPVGPIPGIFLSFASMEAAVDWVKLSDVNGVTQYFEDFNDPDNQSLVNGNAICPSATCTTDFANYFNQQKGTSYNFSQIDSLYLANGIALNVCNTDTSTNTGGITCDSLMTIYNNAVCLYNSLSDPLVNTHQCNIANWVVQGVYNATNKFFQTTELKTPSVISNGYIHMPYPDSSTRYGAVAYNSQRWWRVQNEYALEARVRNIGGTDVDFAINNNSLDDPGYDREEDFYIAFIPQWAVGYYNLQGVRHYDSAFGGRNFNDWRTVKYVVKPDRFQVYFDGQLIKELMRDGHHYIYRLVYPYIKGNVGESVQVDWIKMYGAGDSLMFYENFDNYPSLSRPDPFFLEPRQDCKPFFEQYFNSRTGNNYTYDQIKAYYRTRCGATINFCPEESTLTLCGRAEPVFPPVALDDINNCSDTTFIIDSKAQELYNVYLDSLKGHFDSSYIAMCLQAYKLEQFTVRHAVSEYHHTLYYYDLAGNLIKTVPPAGVRANYDSLWLDSVEVFRAAGSTKVPAHELVTQYRYNTLNSVIGQNSPDGGKTEFWYDRLGRLIISRNARQKAAGGLFSYTRYDALGRITEIGQIKDPVSVSQVSDNLTRNEAALNNWLTGLAGYRGQVTNTIYDLPYTGFGTVNSRLIMQQKNLRNRVSYTSYADSPGVSTAYNTATFYSYDIHGNVDTLLQDYGQSSVAANIMNTQNNRFKKLVYQYDLVSGKVNMVMYQPGWSDGWYHRYRYDAENRLIEAETSLDSLVWEKDARYEYYRHGPLARTVLGQQQVQGIDYAYTLQGWLKGVNSTGGTIAHDMGGDGKDGHLNQFTARDAFGFTLNYFAGEYKPVGNGVDPFPGYSGRLTDLNNYRPLYNGNISSMSVYNRRFEEEPGGPLHFYNYRYDQLNRLTGQDVYKGFDIEANSWNGMTGNNDYLKERIAYDANGNIIKYLRNAMSGSGVAMDSLTYKYYKGTNQLRQVRDAVGDNTYQSQEDNLIADIDNQTDTSNYVYDEIGNLVKDKAEGISNIKWSVYGKILEITRTATDKVPVTTIQYAYDAQGNRIGKITDAGGEKQYTWYVRDAQGNIITTYSATGNNSDLSALQLKQEERYIYGSSRLGMHKYPDVVSGGPDDRWSQYNGTWFDRGLRQYELTNHLGNVLATLSDKKFGVPSETNSSLIAYYNPDIRGAQDYYPFGMLSRTVPDRYGKDYRFGFNGKENDNEVKGLGSQQDYGMRIYDPRVGRFLSVDPLSREYPWNSTYAFAENDVIRSVDLDGLEKAIYTMVQDEGGAWSVSELKLPQAGPLGDGALVKFKSNKGQAFYYGTEMPSGTTGLDFTRHYEVDKTNKDAKGNHVAKKVAGESFTTIGYGHANQSKADAKKYPAGTTITEAQAQELFSKDYAPREMIVWTIGSKVISPTKSAALSDFSYNTTDDGAKTAVRFNSFDRTKAITFFLSNIRNAKQSHYFGLAKRRVAETILYGFGKYMNIDFSKSDQKSFEKIYDNLKKQNEQQQTSGSSQQKGGTNQ
jgi:RHS repeat-associated protein